MKIEKMLYAVLLAGFLATANWPVHADTHVALVGATRNPQELAVVELAEAMLGADRDVILVDRLKIAELLAEQDLSRTGAVLEQHAIRVGLVLEASVFAVLESVDKDKAPWHASVFDARTGEILANVMLDSGKDVSAMADSFAAAVRKGLAKHRIPKDERVPVAIMALRNADLGGIYDSWCMGIGRLIEHSILDTPGTTLLNRRHLEWLNREKDLQGVAAELKASTVRLSVEVRRGELAGSVHLFMRMADSVGNVLTMHESSHPDMDAATIAQSLANAFRSWVTGTEVDIPLTSDPLSEAKRYMADAEYFKAHLSTGAYQAALGATEAALALAPLDESIIYRAIEVLLMTGNNGDVSDVHAIWRCIDISKKRHMRSIEEKAPLEAYLQHRFYQINEMLLSIQRRIKSGQVPEENREALRKAIEETRLKLEDWALDTVMEYYYSRTAPASFGSIRWNIMHLVMRMHWFTPESNAWKLITHGYPLLLEEYERKPFEHQGTIRHFYRQFARLIVLANGQSLELQGVSISVFFPTQFTPTDEHRRSMRPLFEKMIKHPDSIINAYGYIGELALDRHLGGLSETELVQRMRQLQERFRQEILSPSRKPPERYRNAIYGAERDLIDLFIENPVERAQWHQEVFTFMFENRQLDFWTCLNAIHTQDVRFRHYAPPSGGYYRNFHIDYFKHDRAKRPTTYFPILLSRARQILEAHQEGGYTGIGLHWYIESHGSFKRVVESVIDSIYQQRPDLRLDRGLSWKRAEMLYPFKDRRDEILAIAGVRGQDLITVARDKGAPHLVYVLQVPLDGSSPRPWGKSCILNTEQNAGSFSASFAGSGGLLFWTGNSFVHFPSDTEASVMWTPDSGYPQESLTAVAEANGTFVLALSGGYVLGRRQADTKWHLLASARRGEQLETKLDGIMHKTQRVVPDTQRNRTLLVIAADERISQTEQIDGLWSVDSGTLQLTQVLPIPRHITRSGIAYNGDLLLHAWRGLNRSLRQYTHQGILAFNPATDETRMLYALGNERGGMGPAVKHSDETRQYIFNPSANFLVVGDTLWLGNQVILADGTVHQLPPFYPGDLRGYHITASYLPTSEPDIVIAVWQATRSVSSYNQRVYLLELDKRAEPNNP